MRISAVCFDVSAISIVIPFPRLSSLFYSFAAGWRWNLALHQPTDRTTLLICNANKSQSSGPLPPAITHCQIRWHHLFDKKKARLVAIKN
jgi:hypothetical protein